MTEAILTTEEPLTIEQILNIEARWVGGIYVPFHERRRLSRAAAVGAYVEQLIANGSSMSEELNRLRAAAINELEGKG